MSRAAAIFCAVFLLALMLRAAGITFESLWLDEGYQSMVDAYGHGFPDFFQMPDQPFIFRFSSPGTMQEVLQHFRSVDPLCPPLYQLSLNLWISVFGGSDLAVRALSVLYSLGSLSAVYWFTCYLFGWRAAGLAGLVQAVAPFDIYYAHEVRMYSLEMMMATLSSCALMVLLFKSISGWRRVLCWLVYELSVWALIDSHYTGLFVFAFQLAVAFPLALVKRSPRLLLELLLACLAVGILWIPWFGLFAEAASNRTTSFYVARKASLWWPFFALFCRIPSNWVIFLTAKQVVIWAVPLFVAAVVLLLQASFGVLLADNQSLLARLKAVPYMVPVCALFSKQGLSRAARNCWLYLWCWALLPAVGLWLMDVKESRRVIEISRYIIGTAPAIYMLCGVGLSLLNWRNNVARSVLAAYVFFALVQTGACITYFHQREPWHKMARAIEANVSPDQPVLISQYYNLACLDRYLQVPYKQVGIGPAMGQNHIDHVLSSVKQFALVTAQEGEAIAPMIPPRFQLQRKFNMEHGLHLRLYRSSAP